MQNGLVLMEILLSHHVTHHPAADGLIGQGKGLFQDSVMPPVGCQYLVQMD